MSENRYKVERLVGRYKNEKTTAGKVKCAAEIYERMLEYPIQYLISIKQMAVNGHVSLDTSRELEQEAYITLIKCLDCFDTDRGDSAFVTYFYTAFQYRVYAFLFDQKYKYHMSRQDRNHIRSMLEFQQQFKAENDTNPDIRDIQHEFNWTAEYIKFLLRVTQKPVPITPEDGHDICADQADPSTAQEAEICHVLGVKEVIHDAIPRLSSTDQRILRYLLRHSTNKPRTISDMSLYFGISHEQARKLKKQAYNNLKAAIIKYYPDFCDDLNIGRPLY